MEMVSPVSPLSYKRPKITKIPKPQLVPIINLCQPIVHLIKKSINSMVNLRKVIAFFGINLRL